MELIEASEVNVGLVLTKRLSPMAVRPAILVPPYNKIMQDIIKEERVDVSALALKYGPNIINSALDAVKNLNGLGELADWPKILEESAAMYEGGLKLEKLGKKLQEGQPIDWSQISILSRNAQIKQSENLVKLSDVEAAEMPFVPLGWGAFDEHLGGVPEIGLVVVGGRPGVGKTWFMVKAISAYAKAHKDKNVAVFSLEMILSEIAARFKGSKIAESNRPTNEQQQRMLLCDKILGADEIIQMCSTISNLGLVCIDYSDLVIQGAADEMATALLYKTLAMGAKQLGCTIILLSQLSRKQGVPKPSDLRYSGLAEALAWMILMLYDPATDWTIQGGEEDKELPVVDNHAYIIVWKCRGGFKLHLTDFPGAICIPFKGQFGWHNTKSKWYTLKKYER